MKGRHRLPLGGLAFAKATEGAQFRDRRFAANWVEMREAGVLRGAYHFFRPSVDAVVQADHFCDVVGALGPGDLPPVVDVEDTRPVDVDRFNEDEATLRALA